MNETMNALRQTGRTTRMVKAALEAAKTKPVIVFFHPKEFDHYVSSLIKPVITQYKQDSDVVQNFLFAAYDPMGSGFSLQMHEFNDSPLMHEKYDNGNGQVFVDHAVYEVYFAKMLDNLHEYDTVFRIGMSGVMTHQG